RVASHREGAPGVAVEASREGDEPWAARRLARRLEGAIDRLRAGRREVDRRQWSRQQAGEPRGETDLRLLDELAVDHDVQMPGGLCRYRRDDLRVGVPDVGDAHAG